MMKQWILLFCGVFFLLGCQNVSDIKDEGSNQNSEQKTDNKSETQNKDQSHSEIWTNYSDYAKLDQDGFAYTMVNDPDVSSEILPLNDSARNVVLFTFDDAPYEPQSHALQMAQLMKAKDVNAIFLVNGMYLEGEHGRKIVKEIFDMGFEIGNHTTTHPNMRELSYEDQYQEIKKTNDLVEEITGQAPRWFRPPFGYFNMDTFNICNELGLQLMTWSYGYDWMEDYQDATALAQISVENDYLRNGANILMHDRVWTYGALGQMIDGLRENGYHIVDPKIIKARNNIIME